jgi:hypothetical protein
MSDLPDTLERLTERLDILERRVDALEHPSASPASQAVPYAATLQPAPRAEELPFAQTGGLFSVLGKAMLGIAGAYVLRAVAESSPLPRLVVAVVAILYAILWLVWSARFKAGEWLAATIYACTSALIIGPMLWELTLSFNVLSPPAAAGILALFVIAATQLAWKRDLAPVFWVANLTAAVAALALSAATHDLLPFLAMLLLMVLVCEVAAARNRELSVRPLVAAVSDVATWAMIFIYSSPPSARAEYRPLGTAELLAPAILLFFIFAVSVTVRTVVLKRKISVFETGQTLIVFLLAASSLLYFEPQAGGIVLAVLCLVLAAACYIAVFVFLEHAPERRNFHVFATWSAGLFLAGSWLLVPPSWLAAYLGVACLLATTLGVRFSRITLSRHGLLYVFAAAAAAGLPLYAFSSLAGALPAAPAWSISLVTACAVVCYAAARRSQREGNIQRLLQLLPAVLAVCAIAALLVQGLLRLVALGVVPGAPHIAFVRTLAACALALALAFASSRWQRSELNWIAYAMLVFVAAKLLYEDLRHGQLEFIAASIFVFAVTLIAVPRLVRMGQSGKTAHP